MYCSPTCGPFSHSISAHPWPPASDTCTQRLLKVTGLPPSPPRPLLQTSLLGEDQPECSGCPCLSPHHSEQISSFPTAGPAPEPVVCVSGEAGAVNLHRDPLTPPGLERVRGWQPRSLCCGDIPAFSTAEVELQWAKQIKVVLCWYKRT